ncbi:CHAT domain-containing protein [Baaleninema simplex]|uniref:CHAT domain-containing protein n=1 Tax=Baaleninema simplex TaxID=2862350 RepID=UPI00316AE7F0
MGMAHFSYAKANRDLNNLWLYFANARREFLTALKTLTAEAFPKWHFQIVRELAITSSLLARDFSEWYFHPLSDLAIPDSEAPPSREAAYLLRQGSDELRAYLAKIPDSEQRQEFLKDFSDFQQISVDQFIERGDASQAWELAEKGRNVCLSWMQSKSFDTATAETFHQLFQSPQAPVAAIYWHCSPSALNAFLLQPGQPLRLFNSATSATERHVAFQQWWEEWNRDYLDYRQAKDKANPDPEHPWRTHLPERLTQLKRLLDIDGIVAELSPPDSAEPYSIPLVLFPHKELHLVPLEALFPNCFAITRLPSVQTGLALHEEPRQSTTALLSLECPTKDLPMAFFEAAAIRYLYAATALEGDNATPTATLEHLKSAYRYCHFTGHSLHEFPHPDRSLLYLAKGESLTLRQLVEEAENLSSYDLVSLSACETGIARDTDFITEYVGWASGFLAMGAKCVASSLWLVRSDASALLMVRFYELLREGDVPSVARGKAVAWLRQQTANSLIAWYDVWLTRLERNSRAFLALERRKRQQSKIKERDTPLFDDPYFWAALTVVGLD